MIKPRWRSLAVALSAALALLAFLAVSARAENLKDGGKAGKFKIEGSSALVVGATLAGIQEGTSQFLIDGKNAFTECATGTAEDKGISESAFEITFRLHEGNLYILFEGSGAEGLIGTDEYESELCALGFKVKLKGSIVAKVDNGNEAVKHLIEFSTPIKELFQVKNGTTIEGDQVKFGNSEGLYTASWILELTGVHLGRNWSVV